MRDQTRYVNALESLIVAAKRELERFRDAEHPDDLVVTARNAKNLYAAERATSDDRASLLHAIASELLPFSLDGDLTIVGKVRQVIERWQRLEVEHAMLRAATSDTEPPSAEATPTPTAVRDRINAIGEELGNLCRSKCPRGALFALIVLDEKTGKASLTSTMPESAVSELAAMVAGRRR
jgi:hypothetical protein